ncbi:class I SAM-dependent methyltransferase [Flexivirga sp. ID2601S]|uniref:Class I SAM-dependent methyltransferase n=1 Tax=Flexivirga aerilata TaxID=1656889 RepID=A0A849ADA9_9MICO|nr:class I SAM-dependent methyltransferase [Flexivirga aerilata]NNG38495.1 class I SAM-dependent methyltransferase [Flexivirga aerilata]
MTTTTGATTAPTLQQAVTPARIMGISWGIAHTGTLIAALDLGIFTCIAQGYRRAREIATETGCSEEGIARLLDAVGALGLVEPQDDAGETSYALAPDAAAFLVEGRTGYIGDLRHMHHELNFTVWPTLADTVRAGSPTTDYFGSDGSSLWTQVTPYLDQLAAAAQQWLAPTLARRLPPDSSVLDLGCGSGGYSRLIAQSRTDASVIGVDRSEVIDAFSRKAADAGLSGQVCGVAGDLREVIRAEPDDSHDLVMLCNLLHGYDLTECQALMQQVARVLKPSGRVAIFEIVPDPLAPMSNPVATFFGLQMLMTSGGHAYDAATYRALCESVGLRYYEEARCPSGPQTLITAATSPL